MQWVWYIIDAVAIHVLGQDPNPPEWEGGSGDEGAEEQDPSDPLGMIACTITLTLSDYLLIIFLFVLEQEPDSSEWEEGGGGGQGDTEGAGGGDRWPQDDSLYHYPHSQWLFAYCSLLCPGAKTQLLRVRGRPWRPRRYGRSRRWRQMTSGWLFVPSPSLSVIIWLLFSSLSWSRNPNSRPQSEREAVEAKEIWKEQEVETDDLRMIACTITLTFTDYLLVILFFVLEQEPNSSEWEGGGGGQGDTGRSRRWRQMTSEWLFVPSPSLSVGLLEGRLLFSSLVSLVSKSLYLLRVTREAVWGQGERILAGGGDMTSGHRIICTTTLKLSVIICLLFSEKILWAWNPTSQSD